MMSVYSFIVAMVCFNIAMLVVAFLSKRKNFLVRHSTSVLLLFAALAIARMFLPLDFSFSYIIRSYSVLPAIGDALKTDILPGPEYLKISTLFIGVWIAGTVAVICRTLSRLVSERKKRKSFTVLENEQVQRVFSKMNLSRAEITVTNDFGIPVVTGIFKARIFLPELELTDSELEIIIRHEYQHFKSRDILIKLFYLVLSALFWWNPAVHSFQARLDNLLELRCDENVTKNEEKAFKEFYLDTIMKVMRQLAETKERHALIAALGFAKTKSTDFIEQRFDYVLSRRKKAPKSQALFVIFAIVLFLLSFLVIVQPAGFPMGEVSEAGVSIGPENAYILVMVDGSMKLYVDGKYFWDVREDQLCDALHANLPIFKEERQ